MAELLAKNAELVRDNAVMANANRQLQVLLDNIPDRVYFKDTQSRFLKLNQALASRLGVADPNRSSANRTLIFNFRSGPGNSMRTSSGSCSPARL